MRLYSPTKVSKLNQLSIDHRFCDLHSLPDLCNNLFIVTARAFHSTSFPFRAVMSQILDDIQQNIEL